jgi:AcrR family transcriptional regulator
MNRGTGAARKAEPQSAPTGLRERKQRLTRDAIWNAAIDLFAEKGFDDTTIDEIAEAAFVSRRSFFRYFESKNDLMAHPITQFVPAVLKAVDSCPRSASTAELLRHVVLAIVRESAADPRAGKIMHISAKYSAAREAFATHMAGVQPQLEQVFLRRRRDALMAQVLASFTVSAISLITHHWFASSRKDIGSSAHKVFSAMAEVVGG